MTGQIRKLLGAAVLVVASTAIVPTALAGEFVINPLRVTLDRTARSSEIVVRNDDQTPLRMQVQAMTWTQNADGVDQYESPDACCTFRGRWKSRLASRASCASACAARRCSREETYRLFIEELPPARQTKPTPQGTSLRVFLRVGVAVFVTPAQPERKAEISRLDDDRAAGRVDGRQHRQRARARRPGRARPASRATAARCSCSRSASATSSPA